MAFPSNRYAINKRFSSLIPALAAARALRTQGRREQSSLKRAAGRPKDFEAIAELELLLEDEARG